MRVQHRHLLGCLLVLQLLPRRASGGLGAVRAPVSPRTCSIAAIGLRGGSGVPLGAVPEVIILHLQACRSFCKVTVHLLAE